MDVSPYSDRDAAEWDALVSASPTGTFQHTRRFLSYHGDRLQDESLVFTDSSGRLTAVMPAAVSPSDPSCLVSHPGATYGGLVFNARKAAEVALELLAAASRFLAARGFSRFVYKPVPPHLHVRACQADLYAIWRHGGKLVRRDLWNVIDLGRERRMTTRRRNIKLARESGVQPREDNSVEAYAAFVDMLSARLERHSTTPAHTLDEMRMLRDRFPEQITLWVACDRRGGYVAGTWVFRPSAVAFHTQYIAATSAARRSFAQDLLLDTVIEHAAANGATYFSFGASTERDGRALNAGLFDYKSRFGAGSIAQDSYEIDLRTAGDAVGYDR